MTVKEESNRDEQLTRVARALHEEWESPLLWPAIEREMYPASRWWAAACAAAACLVLAAAVLWLWSDGTPMAERASDERLLTEIALDEVRRTESEYERAIDVLSRVVEPTLHQPPTAVLATLRERLRTIDAALAEARTETERNPFNAHMRRQLLLVYAEKQRTLMEIAEERDAL